MTEDKNPSYMFGEPVELGADDTLPVVVPESGEVADPPPRAATSTVTPPDTAASSGQRGGEEVSTTGAIAPVLDTPPPGWKRVSRGNYLKLLLQLRLWTDEQLVAAVHAYYPNSHTGPADVKFNASLIARKVGVKPRTLRVQVEQRELLPPPPWDPVLEPHFETVLGDADLKVVMDYLNESEVAAGGTASPSSPFTPPTQTFAISGTPPSYTPVPAVGLEAVAGGQATTPTVAPKYADEKQPSRFRKSVDPNRQFDKTSLRNNSHHRWIHRDSIAHAERWSFAGRYINGNTDVLDVGCGPDVAMIDVLTMPRNQVPKSYCGVDLNREPQHHPNRQWATLHWGFDFIERYAELGQFDVVINFEMAEHMRAVDQPKLLKGLKTCLRDDGLIFLSTPCFNNKFAAANHLHEMRIDELAGLIEEAGLRVVDRFGTFGNATAIRRVASEEDLRTLERLKPYHSDEMLAVIFACLYPDASRNNLWIIKHG